MAETDIRSAFKINMNAEKNAERNAENDCSGELGEGGGFDPSYRAFCHVVTKELLREP